MYQWHCWQVISIDQETDLSPSYLVLMEDGAWFFLHMLTNYQAIMQGCSKVNTGSYRIRDSIFLIKCVGYWGATTLIGTTWIVKVFESCMYRKQPS